MRWADIASSLSIVLFGAIVILFVIPNQIPGHQGEGYALQAADFPRAAALIFTLLAGIFAITRWRKKSDEESSATPITQSSWFFLGMSAAILSLAALLFAFAGFLVGGTFIVAIFMMMMGERRPLPLLILGIGAPLAIWGFFWKFLQFPLP